MPLLLLLLTAGTLAYFVIRPKAGKLVAMGALTPGKWYRVTAMVSTLSTPTFGTVQAKATVEAQAQGFTGPLAVLPAQNLDGSWAAQITGAYAGTGALRSTPALTILQVEEVQPPAPATPSDLAAAAAPPLVNS